MTLSFSFHEPHASLYQQPAPTLTTQTLRIQRMCTFINCLFHEDRISLRHLSPCHFFSAFTTFSSFHLCTCFDCGSALTFFSPVGLVGLGLVFDSFVDSSCIVSFSLDFFTSAMRQSKETLFTHPPECLSPSERVRVIRLDRSANPKH